MTKRELATVLAALRYWQMDLEPDPDGIVDPEGFFLDEKPLTVEEIDGLCERLNLGEARG